MSYDLQTLVKMTKSSDFKVRKDAYYWLGILGTIQNISQLENGLSDGKLDVRIAAATAIENIKKRNQK